MTAAADARRHRAECLAEKRARTWFDLVLQRDSAGDWCHYLQGREVWSGNLIELQTFEFFKDGRRRADTGAYVEDLTIPAITGERVQYVISWRGDRSQIESMYVTLSLGIGGYAFSHPLEPRMRFRWVVTERERRTARELIAHSLSHDEIAHGEWTAERHNALVAAANDHVDARNRCEYWGTTDGAEWRVRLARED